MDERIPKNLFISSGCKYERGIKSIVDNISFLLEELCFGITEDSNEEVFKTTMSFINAGIEEYKQPSYIKNVFGVDNMLKKAMLLFHELSIQKVRMNGGDFSVRGIILVCYNCLMYLSNRMVVGMVDYPITIKNVFQDELFLDSVKVLEKEIESLIS